MKRELVQRAFATIVFLSVALAAVEIARRIARTGVTLDPAWLCAGIVSLAFGYLSLAWGFHRLVCRAGVDPPPEVTLELYLRSLLARYLPGKIGIPAVRLAGAASLGVSAEFMLTGVVLDSLCWLATGSVVGIALALGPWTFFDLPLSSSAWTLSIPPLALVSVAFLMVIDSARYPSWVLRRLRLQLQSGPLLPSELVIANALLWGCTLLSCAALATALGVAPAAVGFAASVGVVSQLAGFLALPVPAGLGVREAMIVMALSPALGAPRAIAFGLVSRGVALGTELTLWALSRVALRVRAH